jgi:hypothetical protein
MSQESAYEAGSPAEKIRAPTSLEAQINFLNAKGWTDGLPVIPPTPGRVESMIAGSGRSPGEAIGLIPPRWGEATVEVIAANAVMAGCAPEYMPVVLTALEALLEKPYNLYGTQATTHAVAPLLILNGPVVDELGFNYGYNLFGPGWRPNATVGRAVNLVLRNVGGAHPGELDRSTAGQPGKYTFCAAENAAENPWEPLHVERGFREDQSVVTVYGAGGIFDLNDRSSKTAVDLMHMLANSLKIMGSNSYLIGGENLLTICPEHAAILKRDKVSKQELKEYLWNNTWMPAGDFPESYYRDEVEPLADPDWVPLCADPDGIIVIVGGGAGRHSMYIQSFGATKSVSREIKG